jgi:hypothetical protein
VVDQLAKEFEGIHDREHVRAVVASRHGSSWRAAA